MRSVHRTSPLGRLVKAAIGLDVFLAIGALGGGLALMLGPRGEIIPLKVANLSGSPFDTFFVPGLVLLVVLGIGPLAAAALAWQGHPLAPAATFTVGIALLIWLAVEIVIIGYTNDPPLQPFYLVVGAVITVIGLSWLIETAPQLLHRHPTPR